MPLLLTLNFHQHFFRFQKITPTFYLYNHISILFEFVLTKIHPFPKRLDSTVILYLVEHSNIFHCFASVGLHGLIYFNFNSIKYCIQALCVIVINMTLLSVNCRFVFKEISNYLFINKIKS